MIEPLIIASASDAIGPLPGPLGLRLDEEFLPLTSVTGAAKALDQLLPFGHYQMQSDALLLRLWPDTVLVSGTAPDGPFRITDVGHGFARLRLRGVEALHFLANYTYADLFTPQLRAARCVRTRIDRYDCTLWWPNTRDIHILTDRSMAQSLADHLRRLALRHDPADPSTYPRLVAPGAPDRRG